MNTKQTQSSKAKKKKKKIVRKNTPRQRGEYKSYSIRILKRDLDRIQKQARKQQISVNTFILNALVPPVPVTVDEIDDPAKYRIGVEMADANLELHN